MFIVLRVVNCGLPCSKLCIRLLLPPWLLRVLLFLALPYPLLLAQSLVRWLLLQIMQFLRLLLVDMLPLMRLLPRVLVVLALVQPCLVRCHCLLALVPFPLLLLPQLGCDLLLVDL